MLWLLFDQRAQLHRHARGATAGQIGHVQIQIRLFGAHQRRGGPRHAGTHRRQPVFLDPETAAVVSLPLLVFDRDAVFAELGVRWNRPLLIGGTIGAEIHRAAELLPTAVMPDHHLVRPGLHQAELHALHVVTPQVVLHRYDFAGAEQRAVQHAVDQHQLPGSALRQTELRRPDAVGPAAEVEAEVIGGGRADQQRRVVVIFGAIAAAMRRTQLRIHAGNAIGVGAALPQRAPGAVADDTDLGIGHRLALIETGDPHQRTLATPLEVHRQVGDQRGAGHEARFRTTQQRLAQQPRLQLHHVQTAPFQRNADDLHRHRTAWRTDLERLRPVVVREDRAVAGFFAPLVATIALVGFVFGWLRIHPFATTLVRYVDPSQPLRDRGRIVRHLQ